MCCEVFHLVSVWVGESHFASVSEPSGLESCMCVCLWMLCLYVEIKPSCCFNILLQLRCKGYDVFATKMQGIRCVQPFVLESFATEARAC